MLTNVSPRSIADIANFHAHVYYDADRTRAEATTLHGWIAERSKGVERLPQHPASE